MSLVMVTMMMQAVPAKRGIWKTLTLENGTEVRAQLVGDERAHFWLTEDGQRYELQGDVFVPVSEETIQARSMMSRKSRPNAKRLKSPRKVTMGERTHYLGQKKGLVILAQFKDVKFKTANNLAKYKKIMNEPGYSVGSFKGSVSDFFKAQSGDLFELDFDVVGPYTMSQNQQYYGGNNANGDDKAAEMMIIEACNAADDEVNFADYDWDGDGEVDQVFVLYAGEGEADGYDENTIWPHMYTLGECGQELTLDGIKIDTYACSNEVKPDGTIEGIGCFCHEFSHCMGFPDFYDTSYSGWFGMSDFDLMCSGSYNGDTFIPSGYTAHEKMMCGWQDPIVLGTEDVEVKNLKSMSDHGETYIIYNEAHPDEYFMIENRQKTGWDAGFPDNGLMITHVDFDATIWEYNCPNTKITTSSDYYRYYNFPLNDHQRMTIMHADNEDDSRYWSSYSQRYTKMTLTTDLYPYNSVNSLSATTTPAATLYNKNSSGTKTVKWAITNITQNSNGTMNFKFVADVNNSGDNPGDDPSIDPGDDPVQPSGDYLFYESFNTCNGVGGNDGLFSGQGVAGSTFKSDNEGWTAESKNGGDKCAKFGSSKKTGSATTPAFAIDGECQLTFKAAPWGTDATNLTVSVTGNASLGETDFTMVADTWTNFSTTLTGSGNVKLTFTPAKRMFLDEVLVVKSTTNGVSTLMLTDEKKADNRIYDLSGRCVGTDFQSLPHGIYIIRNHKVVK